MNPIIAAVVVAVIVLFSGAIIMSSILPALENTGDFYKFGIVKQSMKGIADSITDMSLEENSRRSFSEYGLDGVFFVKGASDEMSFVTGPLGIYSAGTDKKEGDLEIISGPLCRGYEADADNDGENEFVLENNIFSFAIEKIGNATDHMAIDTRMLISNFTLKKTGFSPLPEIEIDADGTGSYIGTGYTELVSSDAVSCSVRLFMESTVSYDALFTVSGGQDFVKLRVRILE